MRCRFSRSHLDHGPPFGQMRRAELSNLDQPRRTRILPPERQIALRLSLACSG
jgi:hypothetical protein